MVVVGATVVSATVAGDVAGAAVAGGNGARDASGVEEAAATDVGVAPPGSSSERVSAHSAPPPRASTATAAPMTTGSRHRPASPSSSSTGSRRGAAGRPRARRGSAANREAPLATTSFGWASTRTATPSRSATICGTSGMREEPPASSTALRSVGATPARPNVSVTASIVWATIGRIICSNSARVIRTDVVNPGRIAGTSAEGSDDSATLASTHWRRRLASAATPSGVCRAACRCSAGRRSVTKWNTASSKSMPPSRAMPNGSIWWSNPVPSRRRRATSNVPPPRSYTSSSAPSGSVVVAA